MNSNPCSLCACACACACGVHVCMCACACACVRVCVTTARENRQCLLTVMVMTTNTTPSSVPLAPYLCRVVVFISGLGSAIGYGMSAGATTAAMLIASRIPVGLAKQTVTVSRAILADCTPVEKRTGMLHCSTHCAARHSKVTPKPNVDPHLPLSSRTFSVGLPVYMLKSADRDNPLTHGRDVNPRTHVHTYARAHARARDSFLAPPTTGIMTQLMVAIAVGYAAGPIAGAKLASAFGETAPAVTAASVFLCLVVVMFFYLPETAPKQLAAAARKEKGTNNSDVSKVPAKSLLALLKRPEVAKCKFVVRFGPGVLCCRD